MRPLLYHSGFGPYAKKGVQIIPYINNTGDLLHKYHCRTIQLNPFMTIICQTHIKAQLRNGYLTAETSFYSVLFFAPPPRVVCGSECTVSSVSLITWEIYALPFPFKLRLYLGAYNSKQNSIKICQWKFRFQRETIKCSWCVHVPSSISSNTNSTM